MKKKGLKKWAGISLVFAMLLNLAAPVHAESVSPEWDRILKSIAVTNEHYEKAVEENKSLTTKLTEEILKGPYELNLIGELKGAKNGGKDIPDVKPFNGCGIQLSQKNDTASNTYLVQGSFSKNQNVLVSGAMFMSEQLMAVTSKELLGNTYLGINPSTLSEDLKSSIWKDGFKEITEEGIDLNAFFKAQNPKLKQEQFVTQLKKYSAIGKDILQENEAQKTGTAEIELKGNKVSCDEYTITLKKVWIHNYIDKLISTFKKDTELQNLMLGQSGYKLSSELSQELKGEIIASCEELAKAAKDVLTKDVIVKVYINSKDEIIKTSFKTQVINEEDRTKPIEVLTEITLGNGSSLTSNLTAMTKISGGGESFNIGYEMNQTKTNNESSITHQIKTEGLPDKENLMITAKINYDDSKTKDNANLTFNLQAGNYKLGVSARGDLTSDNNNKSVKADFDEIQLGMKDGQDDFDVQLKGNVLLKKIDAKDININGSDVKMVLKMSEKDLTALYSQIEANSNTLMAKMGNLFVPQSK